MLPSWHLWAALTFIAYAGCASIQYNTCICSTGCTCAETSGCSCPFSGQEDGICPGQDQSCLEWGWVACQEEQDLSLPARLDGAECNSQPDGNGFNGKCMKLTADGRFGSETRCSRNKYWLCVGLSRGDSCDDSGGKCEKPDGTDDTTHLSCMPPNEYPCLGKADKASCEILYTGRDWSKYQEQHFYQSVCSQGICLEVQLGACRNSSEGEPCQYSTFDDTAGCTKERVRGLCPAETYYDLYKISMQGGSCTGAFADSRVCEGAEAVDEGEFQGTTNPVNAAGKHCLRLVPPLVTAAILLLTSSSALTHE